MSLDEDWGDAGIIGKRIGGNYTVRRSLQRGPRSEVFEAETGDGSEPIALKVLDHTHPACDALNAHLRDKRALVTFGHPNIVDLTDIGRLDNGDLYVTSALVRGVPLATLVADGSLDQRRALRITRQVLQALKAAHALDVAHRDLRPDHILIGRAGSDGEHAMVLGLGLARITKAAKSSHSDPKYIAPECVVGPHGGPPSDLYSVGAILFELLTGHPPFHADDAQALLRLHAYAPVQTLKQRVPERSFTDATEALVARALEKQVSRRFKDADEMIDALDEAIATVEEAEVAAREAAKPAPQNMMDDSLLLMARDLMPASATTPKQSEPVIPDNVERKVVPLPWWRRTRAVATVGGKLRELAATARTGATRVFTWFGALDRKHQLAAAGGGALLVVAVVIATASGGSNRRTSAGPEPAATATAGSAQAATNAGESRPAAPSAEEAFRRAETLVTQGKFPAAIQLLERSVPPGARARPQLVALLTRILNADHRDAATDALDVLARLRPLPAELLREQAAMAQLPEVRHHAVELAERAGLGQLVDRVASWSLDLEQATSCEQRRALIEKLADTGDPRALEPLRKARATSCVAREANEAIAKLETINAP